MERTINHATLGAVGVDFGTILMTQQLHKEDKNCQFIFVNWHGFWKMHKSWFSPEDQAIAMGGTLNENGTVTAYSVI